jgi:hypothetical protein
MEQEPKMKGWIAVDLDGTLAEYTEWVSDTHIGRPIPRMVVRVREWLQQGRDVRIFTARVTKPLRPEALEAIYRWCNEHIGQVLPVTNVKDYAMLELWDDRCVCR